MYFEAEDNLSGISHYEIKIGEGDTFIIETGKTNPFRLPFQSPGVHNVYIMAVDKIGNFTDKTIEITIESIISPKITVCPDIFISGEEILYLAGSAPADSKVLIFFKKNGESIKEWEVSSDQNGDWFLTEGGLFESGIYEVSARTKDQRGAISNPSLPYFLKVSLKGLVIGQWIVSYKTISSIFTVLLIILFFVICYLLWRTRNRGKLIKREAADLKNKFYKEYNELRADIERQILLLRQRRERGELTEKEREMERELLKNLSDVEKVLTEELKDIERIK